MKPGVKEFFNENQQRCEELQGILDQIKSCVEEILPALSNEGSSRVVRNAVGGVLDDTNSSWSPSLALVLESDIRPGPYKIDWVRNINSCICGMSHRVFLELAFDNAQGVLSNLLKISRAESAYLHQAKRPASSMTIIVTLEKGSAEKLGWDNAVGTRQEYDFAYRSFFSDQNFGKPNFLSLTSEG